VVTVVTKTIGPTGRDYTTFTLAEAAVGSIATAEFGSTDLVANDGAIVFEADAGTYVEILNVDSTLVSDATRNATYRCADRSNRPVIGNGTQSTTVRMRDDFTRFDGIDSFDTSGGAFKLFDSQVGIIVENCEATSDGAGVYLNKSGANIGSAAAPCVVRNVVTKSRFGVNASGVDLFVDVINCTFLPGTTSPAGQTNYQFFATGSSACKLVNCIVLDSRADRQLAATATVTGSNNIGVLGGVSGQSFSTNGVGSEKTPTTSFSTPLGAGDFAVYMGSNGSLANVTGNDVWQQGVGPGSNSDVPTTDINGVARSGATCNPGAFEADGFVAPTVTTQTIGPVGRDFATFTLAEASLPAEDITFTNRAFVFEADAGTYSESVTFSSSLTTDATRQVTYKPAAGSEHGGVFGGGVVLTATGGTDNQLQDDYMTLDGLEFTASGVIGSVLQVQPSTTGVSVTRGLISNPSYKAVRINEDVSSLSLVNCVFSTPSQESIYILESSGTTTFSVVNCTFLRAPAAATGKRAIFMSASGTASVGAEFINCLALEVDRVMTNAGVTPTGSNNFGGATNPFPAALQGSPYPITATTSFSTPLGSGDYAVYMGATGALADVTGNDVWQQGVGPGTNSDVPTTDINGVARSGASCNPGAFEADGFVAPTVITRTVGTASRDYASLALAEADVENIGSSGADLTRSNERIEFVCYADSDFSNVGIISDIVADPTRYVWWKAAPGESPRVYSAGYVDIPVQDSFTRWTGINAYSNSITHRGFWIGNNATHPTVEGMIFEDCEHETNGAIGGKMVEIRNNYAPGSIGTDLFPITYRNLVCKVQTFTGGGGGANLPSFERFLNCTHLGRGVGSNVFNTSRGSGVTADLYEIVNCIILEPNSSDCNIGGGGKNVQGSNNIGNAGAPTSVFTFAHFGIGAQFTPSTAYDPGSGDFALYVGKNGALLDSPHNDVINGGVGPASNSDVPTTDILGDTRSGTTTNPGAFALAQATAVLTRTIGPVGRDYATFTAAEADVENIGGSADLVFENERIEFLADAATYSESGANVSFTSSLVSDATRNVTWTYAAGSNHGGDPASGVRCTWLAPIINDSFVTFDGLVFAVTDSNGVQPRGDEGIVLRNLIVDQSAGSIGIYATGNGGSPSAPMVIENCRVLAQGGAILARRTSAVTADGSVRIVNNTVSTTGSSTAGIHPFNTSTGTLAAEVVNNLVLDADYDFVSSGTVALSGSNNFGPRVNASFAFPAALQGSPYPITPTTNTLATGADLAIYDADTGQLYDLESNAVWQAGAGTSTAGVPKLDILGVVRGAGSANPGAFEAAAVIAVAVSSTLGNNSALHANQLETQIPWIWLYELQTNEDPPRRYRLTNFTQSVQFGLNASGQPLTYSPAPITHGNVEEGTDGSLPTIPITLGHAGPLVGATMDAADGFVGLPVRIMLVSALDIASGKPAVSQQGEVVSAAVKSEAIVLQVSAFNLYQLQFPPFIHSRRRCRWIFGSAECGYNTEVAGAGFSTCNKTLENCEERGDDEVAQGFARAHPARFGAFPGIPRAGQ